MGIFKNIRQDLKLALGRTLVRHHGFWFIDIPRTSSSSIRIELGRRFGKVYGKKNVVEKEHSTPQIFKDHIPAREMRDLLGRSTWDKIFTFTIVRNPWERTFSMYQYLLKKEAKIPEFWSFEDYVHALDSADHDSVFYQFHGYRYGASEYILDENDNIIVDYIAKYENRLHDLSVISSRLGIDNLGELFIQRAAPKEQHYSKFYNEKMVETIRKLYEKDIELFDYEFDSY